MNQDGSDLPNNEPVGVTSIVDVQPPPQTMHQRTPLALFPGELTTLVLSRQSQATTGLIESPRPLIPRVDGEGTVSATEKPGLAGVPASVAPGATETTPGTTLPPRRPLIRIPQPQATRPKPSRAARWFLVVFECFYRCFKMLWWTLSMTIMGCLPGVAATYTGNVICQSLGFPYYRSPADDAVIIGIAGSTIAMLILMIPCFVLFAYFPFDKLFGPPPKRVLRRSNGTTVTVTEDPPYLFLYVPIVYFYALLSIVTITKMTKPESSAGGKLTRSQVARVAALGSLPVSVLYVLVVPFVLAFSQCADRAICNWKRRVGKLEPKVYDDSLLRKIVYQYTFCFRQRQAGIAQPAGDGLA